MLTARTFLPIRRQYRPLWEHYLDENPQIEQLFEELIPHVEAAEIEMRVLTEGKRLDEQLGMIGHALGALGLAGAVKVTDVLSSGVFSRIYDTITSRIGVMSEKYNIDTDTLLVKIRDGLMKMVGDLGVPLVTITAIARLFGYEWDSIAGMVGVIVILYIIYQILKKDPEKGKETADKVVQNKEKVKQEVSKVAEPEERAHISKAPDVLTQSVDAYLVARYGMGREELQEIFRKFYGRSGRSRYRLFESTISARLSMIRQGAQ